ncbi:DUF5133 domain-containing protein [Streptomyces sp. NPDC102406]|uniref:DUF5133 domain-containing protein n=1 Tax=Streptomyces sp. NPDC102406 TaxID=3366171 RepID=UPI00382F9A45
MDASQVGEEIEAKLKHYRWWQRRYLAAPTDARVRERFERTVAALCAATGERCGREAASTAERRLRADRPPRRDGRPETRPTA